MFTSRHRESIYSNTILPYTCVWYQPFRGYNNSTKSCNVDNNHVIATTNGSYTAHYHDKTCDDVPVKNFHRLVSAGRLFFNDLQIVERVITCEGTLNREIYKIDSKGCKIGGHTVMTANYPVLDPTTYSYSNPPDSDCDYESESNRLIISAMDKATASDALVHATLGELEETISGIVQVLQVVSNLLNAYKSNNFLNYISKKMDKKEALENLRDIYMHLRYSMRPLYYDILNYTKALANIGFNARQTFRDFCDYEATAVFNKAQESTDYTRYIQENHTLTESIRTGCLVDLQVSLRDLLGFDRILSSAWELVPLSFVVDWFCNIGKIISVCDPLVRRRYRGTWATYERLHVKSATVTHSMVKLPSHGHVSDTGIITYSHLTKRRLCNETLSYFPTWNVRLNIFKTLDITAILSQLILGKKSLVLR